MTSDQAPSVPDAADRHRRLIAFALLAMGGRFAIDAIVHLAGPMLASPLGLLADGLALLSVALIVPIFLWKARNWSRDDWHLYRDTDGFVADAIARAHTGSWILTFLVLVSMQLLDRTLDGIPWVFLVDIVLAAMLLSFSGIYLYLDQAAPEDSAPADHA